MRAFLPVLLVCLHCCLVCAARDDDGFGRDGDFSGGKKTKNENDVFESDQDGETEGEESEKEKVNKPTDYGKEYEIKHVSAAKQVHLFVTTVYVYDCCRKSQRTKSTKRKRTTQWMYAQ
jgi:hypothetical protein